MIVAENLSRNYGDFTAVDHVSFRIGEGEIVGLLGHNGAGKTTIMKMLTGFLEPTDGSVTINGYDIESEREAVQPLIGYLPENCPIYPEMTVVDFLDYAAELKGVSEADRPRTLRDVVIATGLEEKATAPISSLSRGYRQRVGVAQAIIHEPALLILDEPTHDLDPLQIVEMRNLIRALKGKHTVIISSHILPEIHETCDRLLVIADGRIIASGSEAELTGRLLGAKSLRVTVRPGDGAADAADASERVAAVARAVPGVNAVSLSERDDGALTFTVSSDEDRRAQVCRALVLAGHDVIQLERGERELENVFLELVGEGGRARN
jgi:ABC-2 type transport system ATP-binding protein